MISRRNFMLAAGGVSVAVGAAAAFVPMTSEPALAAKPEIFQDIVKGVGAGAHDVVAYFTEGKPVKGSQEFTHFWKGAEWRFASAENLNKFKANPGAYAPQYGGHCAWAAAEGYTAKGDPRYWDIVDGELYLNFNKRIQDRWKRDVPGYIAKGNRNWPSILTN